MARTLVGHDTEVIRDLCVIHRPSVVFHGFKKFINHVFFYYDYLFFFKNLHDNRSQHHMVQYGSTSLYFVPLMLFPPKLVSLFIKGTMPFPPMLCSPLYHSFISSSCTRPGSGVGAGRQEGGGRTLVVNKCVASFCGPWRTVILTSP